MPKNLTLISITFLLLLSSGLYSAPAAELQAAKEQACQLIDGGKYSEASAMIESLITQHSKNADLSEALYWIAERYRWSHKWQDARDLYGRIKQNYPEHKFALWADLGLARIDVLSAINSRNFMSAEDALNKLIAEFYDHEDAPETLYWLAREFGYAERHEREMQIYQQIVEDYPDSPFVEKARLGIARAEIQSLIASGQTEEAKKALDKMKKDFASHPDLQDALYWIGIRYEWTDGIKEAKNIYEQVAKDKSDSSIAARAKLSLAKTNTVSFIAEKDYILSAAAVSKIKADFSEHTELSNKLYEVAERYFYAGRYDDARGIYQQIISRQPQTKIANMARAGLDLIHIELLINSEQTKAADLAILRITQKKADYMQDNQQRCETLFAIARAYYLNGLSNPSNKEKFMKQASRLLENEIVEHLPIGNYHLRASSYYLLGLIYMGTWDYLEAAQAFEKAYLANPKFRYSDYLIFAQGLCYERLADQGTISQADADINIRIYYERLISEFPQSSYAPHAKDWLYQN